MFVAIGGGGLISGVANYIKAVRPEIKVIGVQMNDSDAMMQSVAANKRVTLPDVGLFSDGTAVKLVGEETFRIARELVDEFMTVDTDAVCAGDQGRLHRHAQHRRAGRRARRGGDQAVRRGQHGTRGETYAAILCGANMNFDRLRFVAERAEVGEEREALFAVTIPEERGSFRRFCELVGAAARRLAQRDRVQLPHQRRGRGARVRRPDHARQGRIEARSPTTSCAHGFERAGPHARRTGQGAHPPHGGRPHRRWRTTSGCCASCFPSGPAR